MKTYQDLSGLFTRHLESYCEHVLKRVPRELYEPENYILSLGGKRLRPLLALIACDLFGAPPAQALDSALAVELFHNFSLVHDDILDAAPLRRNQPTVHLKWNTNVAILSGDVMLVKAFETLQHYEAQQFKTLSLLFQRTAIEVCEGQQEDMNFETREDVDVEDYIRMITNKTAVLLGCSLQMGAINAGAETADQQNIYLFGKHLGIAFQLLDDYLDAFASDPKKFGKQPGGDILANKKTFLLLKAWELASPEQTQQLTSLLNGKPDTKVKDVTTLFTKIGVGELCLAEADRHTQMAVDYLEKVNTDPGKKESLRSFALGLLTREV